MMGFIDTMRAEGHAVESARMDPKTKAYLAKRTAQGHSKMETIRCLIGGLKRYLAREVYHLLNPGRPQRTKQPKKINNAA